MTPERWKKIKDVFTSAQEISLEQRESFLEKECGDDVELRREVEILLSSYKEDEFLENSAIAEAASMFEENKTLD